MLNFITCSSRFPWSDHVQPQNAISDPGLLATIAENHISVEQLKVVSYHGHCLLFDLATDAWHLLGTRRNSFSIVDFAPEVQVWILLCSSAQLLIIWSPQIQFGLHMSTYFSIWISLAYCSYLPQNFQLPQAHAALGPDSKNKDTISTLTWEPCIMSQPIFQIFPYKRTRLLLST